MRKVHDWQWAFTAWSERVRTKHLHTQKTSSSLGGGSTPHLPSSSFSLRAACFDCLICKSSLCKKSLADSSSGWGGLESSGGGEGDGEGPSTSCVTMQGASASWHAASPSPSGDSKDSPLNMERFSDTTGMLRLFFRKMQSLLNSLLALLICSIWHIRVTEKRTALN